jgi:alanine dehydrogenase
VIVGVARESFPGERRVALVPEGVRRLIANKIEVAVTSGAGQAAWFSDDDYVRAGARLEAAPEKLMEHADLVVKINPPNLLEVEALRQGFKHFLTFQTRQRCAQTMMHARTKRHVRIGVTRDVKGLGIGKRLGITVGRGNEPANAFVFLQDFPAHLHVFRSQTNFILVRPRAI